MIPSTVFLVLHCLQVTRTNQNFLLFLFIARVWLVQRGEEEIRSFRALLNVLSALDEEILLSESHRVACNFDA